MEATPKKEEAVRTKEQRQAAIQLLRKGLGVEDDNDLTFLEDTKSVIRYLEKKYSNANTLKTKFSHIVVTIARAESAALDKVRAPYVEKMMSNLAVSKTMEKKQRLTLTEKKKHNSWQDILDVRERMAADAIKADTWRAFQNYVIVCLYTFIEPQRIDFTPMKWAMEVPTYKEGERPYNVCVMKKTDPAFYFFEYKTAKTFGTRKIEISPDLYKVLSTWRKSFNKTQWVLTKADGEPMTEASLGVTIKDIFLKETGKGSTVNTLRHSYISHMRKCEMSLTDKEKMATNMGHSVNQSEMYRKID